jgi:hypothetical protein
MHQIDDVAGDRWCMPVSFITAFFGEGRGGQGGQKMQPRQEKLRVVLWISNRVTQDRTARC